MRHFFLALIMSILFAGNAHAAMTCAYVAYDDKGPYGILTISGTADTTPGTMTCVLNSTSNNGYIGKYLTGKILRTITVRPGAVAPKTDCDVGLVSARGKIYLTNTVNGADLADNTDTRTEYPEGPNGDDYPLLTDQDFLTLTITGNDVNNSIVLFDFELYGYQIK